jgi:O-6-methylguanine DNA methyltransferase
VLPSEVEEINIRFVGGKIEPSARSLPRDHSANTSSESKNRTFVCRVIAGVSPTEDQSRHEKPMTLRPHLVYAMHDSPLGTLGLAATDHGLASLMLRVDEAAYVHYLHNNFNVDVLGQERPLESAGLAPDGIVGGHMERPPGRDPLAVGAGTIGAGTIGAGTIGAGAARILTRTRLFLDRYFAGKQIAFEGPFDLQQGTLFQRRVWATLLTIPYGEVRSYRWLAGTVGHPGAFRAVGTANGQNPIPILIPCHRVVNHGGGLGGYSAGLDAKRHLLALEKVPLAALTQQSMLEFRQA